MQVQHTLNLIVYPDNKVNMFVNILENLIRSTNRVDKVADLAVTYWPINDTVVIPTLN